MVKSHNRKRKDCQDYETGIFGRQCLPHGTRQDKCRQHYEDQDIINRNSCRRRPAQIRLDQGTQQQANAADEKRALKPLLLFSNFHLVVVFR